MEYGSAGHGRARKKALGIAGLLKCSRCPVHRRCNWTRKPKPCKYKNINRITIRRNTQ